DPATITDNVQMSPEVMQQLQQESVSPQINLNDPNMLLNRINFPLMLGMFLFYFLGGYLLYSALFAAVGAAVDSETDTQQFMLPITLPLIFAYMMSFFIVLNPEGPASFWLSIIPLTSPVVMMVRIAIGFEAGDLWQLYLSMSLLVAGFLAAAWIAARIYRTGILMYGKKPSYRELWKWLTYKG
ncbi:MAG: ABC transporter permease, partial [Flavobacteriales bacterium]